MTEHCRDSLNELANMLPALWLEPLRRISNIDFVALVARRWTGPRAQTLAFSFSKGLTTVEEVSEAGSVGRVRVSHGGKEPLLLVDGEQIVGAKQNRIFNASFLVAPGTSVVLPVSCVERGRWCYRGNSGPSEPQGTGENAASSPLGARSGQTAPSAFFATRTTMTAAARGSKLRRVTLSRLESSSFDANQGAVWRDVDDYLSRTRVTSVTGAMQDAMAARAGQVESAMANLAVVADQVGVAAVANDRLLSLDLFGSSELLRAAWESVMRGILADVTPAAPSACSPEELVRSALVQAARIPVTRTAGPGWGESIHGARDDLALGAVVRGGELYHAYMSAV